MASPFLLLAEILYQKPFRIVVPNDINRVTDGQMLREAYCAEKGLEGPMHLTGCNMLELLIGISERLYIMYQDSPYEKKMSDWFRELLSNLRIGYITDGVLTEHPEYAKVADDILNALINREYSPNGDGGLFPLRRPTEDQRGVEIWDQMMAYCAEKYNMGLDEL